MTNSFVNNGVSGAALANWIGLSYKQILSCLISNLCNKKWNFGITLITILSVGLLQFLHCHITFCCQIPWIVRATFSSSSFPPPRNIDTSFYNKCDGRGGKLSLSRGYLFLICSILCMSRKVVFSLTHRDYGKHHKVRGKLFLRGCKIFFRISKCIN